MTARTCPLCERLRRADVRHWGAAWAVVTVASSWLVGSWVSLEPADPPPAAEVRRTMDVLRAAAEGSGSPVAPAADGTTLHGPVRVVLWHDGMPVFRREFDATTMADLVARASKEIDDARSAGRFARVDMSRARLHLSFVVAEGPVLAWPPLAAAASFVTTLDGAALRVGDATVRLWPDDLLRRRLYSAFLPLPGGVMKAGLDVPRAVEALWAIAGHPDERRGVLRRFRTAEFVERPGGDPEPLVAGRVIEPPPGSVSDLRSAALEGVRWLDAAQRKDGPDAGRFDYDYDPISNGPFDAGYSLPRHGGAAWFLAFAHRKTGDAVAREAAGKALEYLAASAMRSCGQAPGECVGRERVVELGSAALAAVAMAEYERATGEGRFVEPLRRLIEFIEWMQEPSGDFVHLYDVEAHERLPDRLPYYTGEAALALVLAYRVTGERALLDRAHAALDHLTKRAWSFFGSAYFYGEEHWTCIAAHEAFPEIRDDAYLEFCEGFARFLREMQTAEGEPPFGWEGSYVVTPFLAPRTTPVSGRTEATVATYKLGLAMGRPNLVVLEQVRRSLTFLVRMRYGPEPSPLFARPGRAAGGMPGGLDDPVVRIDHVQHAGLALLGGADILGDYVIEPP